MKGNNDIIVNMATMIEAMEYYLNNVIFKGEKAVEVVGVEQTEKSSCPQFRINITEPKKATA